MKKVLFLTSFLFCAVISLSQVSPPFVNNQSASNEQTIFHYKGALKGDVSLMFPVVDTLDNPATPYSGAVTVLPSDAVLDSFPVYMSNGRWWFRLTFGGTGGGGVALNDTVYVTDDLYVTWEDVNNDGVLHQVIHRYHSDGLVDGTGIVTWISGLTFAVTPAQYWLNRVFYTTLADTITLAPSDPTNPRIDVIAVDTSGFVVMVTGTPAATPLTPPFSTTAKLSLTTILIDAGATTPTGVSLEQIYFEGVEWDTARSGTINIDFRNTLNPFANTYSAYVSSYSDGSQIIFTDLGPNSAALYEVLNGAIYLNGELETNNALQFQFYMGTTPVSNNLSVHSGFGLNPLDSNVWQPFSIPFSNFTFPNSYVFDRLVITHAGDDLSGTKGYYLDNVQLQQGINNVGGGGTNFVDSVTIVGGEDYYWINGVPTLIGPRATGLATVTADNGLTKTLDNIQLGGTLLHNTSVDGLADYTMNFTSSRTTGETTVSIDNTGIGVGLDVNAVGDGPAILANSNGAAGVGINTTGFIGIVANSSGGSAITANATSGAGAIRAFGEEGTNTYLQSVYASTDIVEQLVEVVRSTSGTAANGIGVSIDMEVETTDDLYSPATQLISKWTDATEATKTSQFILTGVNNSVTSDLMTISGDGSLRLNNYVGGAFSGTPAYDLTIDASGNVIASALGAATVDWHIIGNAGTTGANYIGTNDNIGMRIRVNNLLSGRIDSAGTRQGTSFGMLSLPDGATGLQNSAFGYEALQQLTTGSSNTAIGNNSFQGLLTQGDNTGVGASSGFSATGFHNTFIGAFSGAGASNTGYDNTGVGYRTLYVANLSGIENTAAGRSAGENNTSGIKNTYMGAYAGNSNQTSEGNSAFGAQALNFNTGGFNAGFGHFAGYWSTTLSNQIFINSRNRSNFVGDQTQSPLYVLQNTSLLTILDQKAAINAKVGVHNYAPTAFLHLPANTTAANTAPIKLTYTTLTTTGASGTFPAPNPLATLTFAAQAHPPFIVGSIITVAGVTPAGYNGTWTVVACTTTSVSFQDVTTGAQTVAGTITQGFILMTTPEPGAIESDGTNIFWTDSGGTRRQLNN